MKVNKTVSVQGKFAKIGTDIKDGDLVTILDQGQMVKGQYGDQHVFKVKTPTGEFVKSFNQTTMNTLIESFGDETSAWVGKNVLAFVVRMMVSNKLQNVAYFAPEGYEMTDDGQFVKTEA